MNRRQPRRRFRVVARPKDRARKVRGVAAVLVIGALGAVAFAVVRKAAADFRLPVAAAARADATVIVEGPEPLRSFAQTAVDAMQGSAGEKAEALKAKYPSLSDVRVRRNWTEKRATLTLVARRPVAAATRRGKPAGYLGDDGFVFHAPEGAFQLAGPSVEIGDAGPEELAALAREWPTLSADGSFPAALSRMAYEAHDGWEATLADGAKVRWGRLEWTKEKLARLAEAVADARAREPGAFSADLRWFEDGKVLLRRTGKL